MPYGIPKSSAGCSLKPKLQQKYASDSGVNQTKPGWTFTASLVLRKVTFLYFLALSFGSVCQIVESKSLETVN